LTQRTNDASSDDDERRRAADAGSDTAPAISNDTSAVSDATHAVSGTTYTFSGAANVVSGGAHVVSGGADEVSGGANMVSDGADEKSGAADMISSTAETVSSAADMPSSAADASSGRAEGGEFVLRVRGLTKRYRDGTEANRGIDMDVRRGEVIAVLGPNGAGKTTLLRQVTTELRPSAGTVEVFGVDAVARPDAAKRLMGITPQEAGVFETLSVRQHFELFARLKGLRKREAREDECS